MLELSLVRRRRGKKDVVQCLREAFSGIAARASLPSCSSSIRRLCSCRRRVPTALRIFRPRTVAVLSVRAGFPPDGLAHALLFHLTQQQFRCRLRGQEAELKTSAEKLKRQKAAAAEREVISVETNANPGYFVKKASTRHCLDCGNECRGWGIKDTRPFSGVNSVFEGERIQRVSSRQ